MPFGTHSAPTRAKKSSCPPDEHAEVGTLGERVLKGIRRRWQQASLARAEASSDELNLKEATTQQRQLEVERPATSAEAGRGALKAAAAKHSAVKSKPSKPLAVLQSIAENIESMPEHSAMGSSHSSAPCGQPGQSCRTSRTHGHQRRPFFSG